MRTSMRLTGAAASAALLMTVLTPGGPAAAKVALPGIFADNMVLQRDRPVFIWGRGAPEEEVIVTFGPRRGTAAADAKGKWSVTLPAMKAGGPHKLTIAAENTVAFNGVLLGEVWLYCGQEDLDSPLHRAPNGRKEAAAAKDGDIRLCRVKRRASGLPVPDVAVEWIACEPKTALHFPAAGYYFAAELRRELKVPVGLVCVCWHGVRIDSLTPAEAFFAEPKFQQTFVKILEANKKYNAAMAEALPAIEAWVKVAAEARKAGRPMPVFPEVPRHEYDNPWHPTSIYNGMLHPIAGFGIRGVIFYQGGSNLHDGPLYRDKLQTLISGWRQAWGRAHGAEEPADFGFYFAQLACPPDRRRPLALPTFWEAQRASLAVQNTGMVPTADLADKKSRYRIKDPRELGRRFSLWAMARDYAKAGVTCCGPLYKSMETAKDGTVRVRFDHVGSGLVAQGGPLSGFELAGGDGKFVKAAARIDGREVVVSSEEVPRPVTVRLGWDPNAPLDLYNQEGLPAFPFRAGK